MKSITAFLTLLVLGAPAWADVKVSEFRVVHKGTKTTVRINFFNPTTERQDGPVQIILFARQTPDDSWQSVKTWTDVASVAPYGKVSKTEDDNPQLQKMIEAGGFEAKLQISAPKMQTVFETTSYRPGK